MEMASQIFVNLPVKDLKKTMEFWRALGFGFNKDFTDEKAASLVLGKNLYAMLLTEKFFQTFTSKAICDTGESVEVLNALAVGSRKEVDELLGKGLEAGGKEPRAAQDHGWMYSRALEDIDGHAWEFLYMDAKKLKEIQAKGGKI